MLAATLVTNRKLCHLLIVSQFSDNVQSLTVMIGFRKQTEDAIQALIDKRYEQEGDISIDEYLGETLLII